MRWIGYVATILWWSGIARSLSTLNRGHSYKISPKPCKVPGSEVKEGTCMFVWECIKSEGTHVGVCVDTFMFGSCCVHNTTVNTISSSQQYPHHHHTHPHHHHQQQPHDSLSSTLRPTLLSAEPVSNESTRLTSTSFSSSTSWMASSTARPSFHHFSESHHSFVGGSTRPMKPFSSGLARPLQKRPHAKPTSEHDVDRSQTPAIPSASPSSWADGRPQVTKRPGHHGSHPHQKTRPDAGTPGEKPSSGSSSQPGFKDKPDTAHNTLAIRLPGKEHASAEDKVSGSTSSNKPSKPTKPNKPSKPSNQRPFESRPDDGKTEDADLSVQETIHRPNVNSVMESDTAKEPHPSLNFIHTERPHWATKPAQSKPTTDFSKPYFSIKTTTYRPISISSQADHRPNFISKPNTWSLSTKTSTTTARPTYVRHPSTSAAGSIPQTSHWQVTTEPAFVTKQKPSSLSSSSFTLPSSSSTSFSSSSSSSSPSSSSSSKPITTVTASETVRVPPLGTSSHFWSNSWTPPRPSLKPHWTDNPGLLQNGPENFPPRPSFKPTESLQSTEYQKPLGSAHYITTSHLETSTRPRPTKKTTTLSTTSSTVTSSATSSSSTASPVTAMATMTTTSSTTSASTASVTVTTQAPSTTGAEVAASEKTGSVMTVAAADESKGMQCGVPPLFPRPETRIVGGKDAPFGRWPWQVSVRRTSFFGFSSTHRCGGAVLNENWIATAGHCVDDLLTSQIRIRVGEYDFSSVQERLPYVERGIAKKVVHPKYNFFTYEYDLALVRLESSLTFAAHISPICLPATDDLLIGENATVTGWGRLSEGGTLPSVLQEVSVPIVSNDRCKSMFLRAGRHEFIPDIFLCAGYETGGQDSCQGDSGGPLQVRGKDGRYFLAGIISWGIGCAEANLPGVCTRISKFVPWILKNVT
ncbi:PREDICTED: serine proteinase stubble-like [Dinoponera quadriceps]|uniref:Serine proteinase stubble-like n=1 Tax=Dinoponera quadriceps TaxID=609295 RepID=A0A6P3YA77_DINQU|nr:PREDICTED: serine proteinase stubble-like [Dinoponera quadriceps]XP_014486897.1 PREDICTED: serine proteinase stubble-like [Dinoponera quadriceps]XP_014486898.1 PREDICTED: serine proteinase stubble-like [Dinoponera quadriceps]XP_014486899.1 PREDICTED: serine proteinase stubble-like [Dinoponera quadriceps]